jgi:ABC-type molybdate transport system substrate-binding protein
MSIKNTEKSTKEEDIVKAAWGTMTLGKKLEYLWMYYKGWLAGALCLVLAVSVGVTMYKGMHTTVLLNAVVIGGDDLKAEWLMESFAQYAEIGEKDGVVQIRTNIPDDGGGMMSTTALTTLMGADAIDVLVCPADVYEDYDGHDGFFNMKEILGEKAEEYGDAVLENGVRLKAGNILEKEQMTAYEEIYVAIPVNSQNPETAVKFVEYLLQ